MPSVSSSTLTVQYLFIGEETEGEGLSTLCLSLSLLVSESGFQGRLVQSLCFLNFHVIAGNWLTQKLLFLSKYLDPAPKDR